MARPASKPPGTLIYPLASQPNDPPNGGGAKGGFVHDWLVTGPFDQPLRDPSQRILQPEIAPVFITELDRVQLGNVELIWEIAHCEDDHWLAWHGFANTPLLRQTWGFVHLHSAAAQRVILILTVNCAAQVWLNGDLVFATPDNTPPGLATCTVDAPLQAGSNPLLLHLRAGGVAELSMLAALRVEHHGEHHGAQPAVTVQLPTVTRAPRRRQRLEASYAQTCLDRAVYTKNDPIRLLSPGRDKNVPVLLRLQKPTGAIYAETISTLNPQATVESVRGSQLPNGALDAVVMAPFQLYYTEKLRAARTLPLLIANHAFTSEPSGHSADERLIEALAGQAQAKDSIYAELAKMAFGWWEDVDSKTIEAALQRVLDGDATSLPDLLGLITLRARMAGYRGFPAALLPTLDRGLSALAAAHDPRVSWDTNDEANQLASMAARHLLAQLYPQTQHTAPDAAALVEWMVQRGRSGFSQWHSRHDLLVSALAPLLSLAQDESVREVAASLLDLVAYALGLHSFGGAFGASRGRVDATTLRSARFAPEAALTRLWWGTGGYAVGVANAGLAAATAVALAGKSYVLPDAVRTIALSQPGLSAFDALVVQERHAQTNIVSVRTPDFLITSAQSHRPGERGAREQIWQATLSAEAAVFSNHPATFSQADAAAPGWWVGNGVLPRVAQYQDALIALYALPGGDSLRNGLNFSHAYFPIYAFDEHVMAGGWAFARVGNGYLALTALPGFALIERGADAGRELRVDGNESAWLCQMGRQATDGNFATFQHKVLASAPHRHDARVTWTTLRGDTLVLGIDGPFTVNGQIVPLEDFPRHHSPFAHAPFPAEQLEIVAGEDALRLHF